MAHPNEELLRRFYTAFSQLDAATMVACYADDAVFDDAAFALRGKAEVGAMWTMLCEAVKEKAREHWQLEFSAISADDQRGRAHWEPRYRFTATGRPVHNIIDATFEFRDGLIVRHHDQFDFWRWSRQALGPVGLLLGWTPWLRGKVRAQAAANLARYRQRG